MESEPQFGSSKLKLHGEVPLENADVFTNSTETSCHMLSSIMQTYWKVLHLALSSGCKRERLDRLSCYIYRYEGSKVLQQKTIDEIEIDEIDSSTISTLFNCCEIFQSAVASMWFPFQIVNLAKKSIKSLYRTSPIDTAYLLQSLSVDQHSRPISILKDLL